MEPTNKPVPKRKTAPVDFNEAIRSLHTMELGSLLTYASIGFGAYRGWPTALTLVVAAGVDVGRRVAIALFPTFMGKIDKA